MATLLVQLPWDAVANHLVSRRPPQVYVQTLKGYEQDSYHLIWRVSVGSYHSDAETPDQDSLNSKLAPRIHSRISSTIFWAMSSIHSIAFNFSIHTSHQRYKVEQVFYNYNEIGMLYSLGECAIAFDCTVSSGPTFHG